MRLLSTDFRWRDDKYYILNLFDRLTQSRLLTVNNMLSASTTIRNNVDASKLKDKEFENYFKYGSHIPRSITGSKSYWKGKYSDYKNTCPIFHPVDVSEYFFQNFLLLMKEIKNGILGKYTHSWYRVE